LKIYLVGGAVRDALLNRPVKERDWVVVGSTPEEMVQLGYTPVGKEFPVFLHPKTREEYALARTEKKISRGYQGFDFYTDPAITLEEDLRRRDLTINAIAKDEKTGQLFDPYGGQADLKKKQLRHVSEAFVEDPVRVLRIARFAATLERFVVADETNTLMKEIVASGELDALVAERVWQEFHKALCATKVTRFFEVLADCHALSIIFPEFPSPPKTLCEVDSLAKGAALVRFSLLTRELPEPVIRTLCKRLRTPKAFLDASVLLVRCFSPKQQTPEQLLKTLEKLDAFRRPARLDAFLLASKTIDPNTHQVSTLNKALLACQTIDIKSLIQQAPESEIPGLIRQRRLTVIREM
jgi:tRNA nucleotidyltransferase (CCA-adding enzyme)